MQTIVCTRLTDVDNPNWAALHGHLWEEKFDDRTHTFFTARRTNARLSKEDWKTIKKMIVKNTIPVTMDNTSFGFSVGITLWTPRAEPFPDAVEEPRPLVTISAHHLPDYESGSSFDLGWAEFFPLTHSKRNLKLLEQNELPPPKDMADYVY